MGKSLDSIKDFLVTRNGLVIASMVTINVIICVFAVLQAIHINTEEFLTLVLPLITVLVNNIMIAKQNTDIKNQAVDLKSQAETNQQQIQKVESQTNGKLDQKFADLKEHITNQIAGTTTLPNVPSSEGDVG